MPTSLLLHHSNKQPENINRKSFHGIDLRDNPDYLGRAHLTGDIAGDIIQHWARIDRGQSESAVKRSANLAKARKIPCLIHIALKMPNGDDVDDDTINTFLELFDRHYEGSSILGTIPGRWLGLEEPMLRVEVAVPVSAIREFEELAVRIGRQLKQKVVYVIENYQANVRFLQVDPDAEAAGGEGGGT
jgi:hypothetical protein